MKNATIYRISHIPTDKLEAALKASPSREPTSLELETAGWVEPTKNYGSLVMAVGNADMIALKKIKRVIPASVVKRETERLVAEEERRTGFKVGRKLRSEFKQLAIDNLTPKAFLSEKTITAFIDEDYLFVDATGSTADDFVLSLSNAYFKQFGETLDIKPWKLVDNGCAVDVRECFTYWMRQYSSGFEGNYSIFDHFDLPANPRFKSELPESSVLSGKNASLSDIEALIEAGHQITELELDHKGTTFRIDEKLTVRGIKWGFEPDNVLEHLTIREIVEALWQESPTAA